jgi:glycosyltransferase involved in cell wall biosynthesis
MESMVSQLAKTADVVFATSTSLVEKLAEKNPNTFLASHGVKYDLFRTALSDELSVPEDLLSLQKPVVGYYGLIEDWMDLDLVAAIAKKHPEWSIVLIGKVMVDTSAISSLPNVHLLGRKPHHELPAYCKGFSVGILPHKVNSLTINMNPIKLREYLSAGLPVVATDLPEVRRGSELCVTTKSYEEFEEAVAAAIASDTRQKRRERSESMSLETWDRKVEALGKLVSEAQSRKYGSN